MRHAFALAFLLAALGIAVASTQALLTRHDGPGLLWFMLAPVRVFDGSTCG